MRLYDQRRPKGFRLQDPFPREKRFDFHREHPKARSLGSVVTLVVLLILLLALWKIFN